MDFRRCYHLKSSLFYEMSGLVGLHMPCCFVHHISTLCFEAVKKINILKTMPFLLLFLILVDNFFLMIDNLPDFNL